jgi:hypothetical protein
MNNSTSFIGVESFLGLPIPDKLLDKKIPTIQGSHIQTAMRILSSYDENMKDIALRVFFATNRRLLNQVSIGHEGEICLSELKQELVNIINYSTPIDPRNVRDDAALMFYFLKQEIPLSDL